MSPIMAGRGVLGALLLLGLLVAPAGAQVTIPLTVTEPAKVARVQAPVTSGVPLPAGTTRTNWALFDGTTQLPLQLTTLKGRVPWVLLDFQIDLAAGQTKTLTLKEQAPGTAGPVLAPTPPPTTLTVTLAGSPDVLVGVPTATTWEYQGPVRSVLRVDGRIGTIPGFGYTTRYTFYRGKQAVRVETVLRNSLQGNLRTLKLTRATMVLGAGGPAVQALGGMGSIVAVPHAAAVFELLPLQQHGVRNPLKSTGRPAIPVAENGGYLLPDLTHYGVTLILDPAGQLPAPITQLFALAPSAWYAEHGELSTRQFGSLDDEKTMYRRLGWTWKATQEPRYAHQPTYNIHAFQISIHSDSEGDDVHQNLLMLLRTGQGGYLDRARGWANFHKWEMPYRTDGFAYGWDGNAERTRRLARPELPTAWTPTAADPWYLKAINDAKADSHTWGGDHIWGWGLLDYYWLTGDVGALEAAADVGEQVETLWLYRTSYFPLYGLRGPARNLMVAVRLYDATGDARWKALADHLVGLFILQDSWWREDWGVWGADSAKGGFSLGPHHTAEWHGALYRYYERLGQNPEVKRRLIKMSTFARDYALDPTWQQSPKTIVLARTPGFWGAWDGEKFWTPEVEPIINPYHTWVWVDTVARGYRLTGDPSYLKRALYLWDRGSKGQYFKLANYRIVGDTQVGSFANALFSCCGNFPVYFRDHGNLPFLHHLHWDAARADPAHVVSGPTTPPVLPPPPVRPTP